MPGHKLRRFNQGSPWALQSSNPVSFNFRHRGGEVEDHKDTSLCVGDASASQLNNAILSMSRGPHQFI